MLHNIDFVFYIGNIYRNYHREVANYDKFYLHWL